MKIFFCQHAFESVILCLRHELIFFLIDNHCQNYFIVSSQTWHEVWSPTVFDGPKF